MLQIPAATFEVDRVKTFLRLLLVSAGYYCLDAKHLDVTVLVAGKDDNGFIILMTHAPDPMLLPSTRAEVPPELAFLKLPVHHVVVTPGQWPNDGREVLLGSLTTTCASASPWTSLVSTASCSSSVPHDRKTNR